MTREWMNSINSFNSLKCLCWREHLEGIANKQFLKPVAIALDPSNICNLNCLWCIARTIRKHNRNMENILDVCRMIKEWGVKAVCIGGGGEPFANRETSAALYYLRDSGIEIGMATNGTLLNSPDIEAIVECNRFCGISIDAGCKEDYLKLKKGDCFNTVLSNIMALMKRRAQTYSKVTFCYKFLIHPQNYKHIYDATAIALNLGMDEIHIRPAWLSKNNEIFEPYMDSIFDELDKARELETEAFRVYTIQHKFLSDFKRKKSSCLASPLQAVFCADGYAYLCPDRKGNAKTRMCKIENIQSYWGSESHIDQIKNMDTGNCPRCTYGPQAEIIEQAIIEDNMYRRFV